MKLKHSETLNEILTKDSTLCSDTPDDKVESNVETLEEIEDKIKLLREKMKEKKRKREHDTTN